MDIDTSIFRNKTFQGDCVEVLRTMPDNLIDCCITSPPYYGLRDYGIDGQIGLEQTPEAYIVRMVEVFREVRRVLKPEGTLWLNLGDSYAGSWGNSGHRPELDPGESRQRKKNTKYFARGAWDERRERPPSSYKLPGLKPKDLIGIPWRAAFALQADGWWLRQDVIWQKPNCMPDSTIDRCTRSHEYLFLLTKNKKYYYDAYAIREEATSIPQGKRNRRSVWTITTKPFKGAHFAVMPEALAEPCILAGTSEKGTCPNCGKPWVRQVEHKNMVIRKTDRMSEMGEFGRTQSSGTMLSPAETKTIGWLPSCSCGSDPVPGIVLDPFFGAGTTGLVSKKLGRDFVGIELNPDYIKMAEERIFGSQTL